MRYKTVVTATATVSTGNEMRVYLLLLLLVQLQRKENQIRRTTRAEEEEGGRWCWIIMAIKCSVRLLAVQHNTEFPFLNTSWTAMHFLIVPTVSNLNEVTNMKGPWTDGRTVHGPHLTPIFCWPFFIFTILISKRRFCGPGPLSLLLLRVNVINCTGFHISDRQNKK